MRFGTLALALAGALTLGVMTTDGASAAPLSPATAPLAETGLTLPVENVAWVCRGNRCTWDPRFRGRAPRNAGHWGPPRHRGCFYEKVRDRRGHWRWVEVCRRR